MARTRIRPVRRALHLVADLLLLGWVVAWALVAWTIKQVIEGLAAPAEEIGNTTDALAQRFDDAVERISDVALVGEELAAPLRPIAGTLRDISDQAALQVASVNSIALMLFFVVWLIPSLSVAVLYLPPRIRRARESAQARRFIDERADLDLFALRAMAKAPMTQLARITDDPVAAWRTGDRQVIDQLADLELRRVGIGVLREPTPRA